MLELPFIQHVLTDSLHGHVCLMTKPSTVPYAHEPGLIARLLGVALEAVNAYGVSVILIAKIILRFAYMQNRVSFPRFSIVTVNCK